MFKQIQTDRTLELDYLDNLYYDMVLPTTQTIIIDSVFAERPDRIAYKMLGDFNLGWLICWHNDIDDPVNDLQIGKVIDIPSVQEFYRYLNKQRVNKRARRR